MINLTRRAALKLFSAAGITTLLPSLTSAKLRVNNAASTGLPEAATDTPEFDLYSDIELVLQRVIAKTRADDYALVTIRNLSDETSTLRYIYPGVVEGEGNHYDLNAMLPDKPLTLEPGQTVYRRLKPMQQLSERQHPPVLIARTGKVVFRNYLMHSRVEQPVPTQGSVFA